eukprot:4400320-Amphidinium_carterae.1
MAVPRGNNVRQWQNGRSSFEEASNGGVLLLRKLATPPGLMYLVETPWQSPVTKFVHVMWHVNAWKDESSASKQCPPWFSLKSSWMEKAACSTSSASRLDGNASDCNHCEAPSGGKRNVGSATKG